MIIQKENIKQIHFNLYAFFVYDELCLTLVYAPLEMLLGI